MFILEQPDISTIEQQVKVQNKTNQRKPEIKVRRRKANLTKHGRSSFFGWLKLAVVRETVDEDSARSDYL